MKSIIKTTFFISVLLMLTINARQISKKCIDTYDNCVAFIVANAYVPYSF